MSNRRKRRRAAERRLRKARKRVPTPIWAAIVFALIVLAVGIARITR